MPKTPVQKWKLAAEVREVARELDRPVCSADLRRHFKAHPDRYPLYVQRLGQVLIKIARERPVRAIWPLGKVGFYAFYAPDDSPVWREKLRLYHLLQALDQRLGEDFPGYVGNLLGGPHDALARNALAGFVEEWSPTADNPLVTDWTHLPDFRRMLSTCRASAPRPFVAATPRDIVSRDAAAEILRREYRRRVDEHGDLGFRRHLARLVWPQTRLLPSLGKYCFCKAQLLAYAADLWPIEVDEAETAAGLVLALRYGLGASGKSKTPGRVAGSSNSNDARR